MPLRDVMGTCMQVADGIWKGQGLFLTSSRSDRLWSPPFLNSSA